jgi:Ca-activated chloride channel family protein
MPTPESIPVHQRPTVGLLAADVPIPLEGVSVEAEITGVSARVVVSQRYRNRESQPLEATYVFPLDEGAAVCGFEAVSNGVGYLGEVKPRDEAFKDYDDALQQGDGAYLLDEERPDVFTASIGNVPPGAEVWLRLTYVTELAIEGDAVRFVLPTTVSPRYAPAEDRVGVGRSQEETLNPPVAWTVPYGLDVALSLAMPGRVTRIESPTHPIAVAQDGARATVTLAQARAALDRDLVVVAGAEGLLAPHALVERTPDGQHAAGLVFRPDFQTDAAPAEIVFVVDRSGSMGGTSIAEVRNALQLCLRSLTPGSRFNIVGFGSTFVSLFPESVPYDEDSLARASAHVASLEASLGGTEILPALAHVFGQPLPAGMVRQIVVLTDGEVTNTDAVIALVKQHASATRVFTFGIGRGASAHLVKGVARAGNGAAEFIQPGERAEAKILRQFARMLAPALRDVRIDWGGLDVTPAPASPPPVFAGERLVVYALVKEARAATITLSGRDARGPVSVQVRFDPAAAVEGRTLATLAARALIRDLEESPEGLVLRGSQQRARKQDRVRDDIVRLGVAYGLASRETSFVAVEHRTSPVEGEAVLRRIPVALTSGWSGLEEATRGALHRISATLMAPGMAAVFDDSVTLGAFPAVSLLDALAGDARTAAGRGFVAAQRQVRHVPGAARAAMGGARDSSGPASPADRMIDRLVALQRADGSWDLTPAFASAMGLDVAGLEAGLDAVGTHPDARQVWATALALAWLEHRYADAREEWTLLARKARRWLGERAGDAQTLSEWEDAAARAIEHSTRRAQE